MPKNTFLKLNPAKKKLLIDSFLKEFGLKPYDEASLTQVVKSMGIAKGSIYQYFNDKLDLFLYLQSECNAVKMNYVANISRDDYPDFWSYYKALYTKGINFDINHPLESNFLHNIAKNIHSPSLKELAKEWKKQAIGWMSSMIQNEVDLGNFRKDKPVKAMAFLLFQTSNSIGDYMHVIHGLDIDQQIQTGKSVYAGQRSEMLLKAVDEYILLLKNAFKSIDHDQG